MTNGLTPAQKRVLDYIRYYIERNGYSPSFDDIKDAIGLRSKSGVHRLVNALRERGHITFLRNRARSITLGGFDHRETLRQMALHLVHYEYAEATVIARNALVRMGEVPPA